MPTATVKMDSIKVVDGRLLVDVAVTAGHKSASGKSTVLYTTGGNIAVGEDMKIGITLFKKV